VSGLPKIDDPPTLADPRAIDQRSGKPKRVTKKLKHAVRLMLTGECITLKAAAERAKISPEHFSRSLRQPHVRVYLDEQCNSELAAGKPLAAHRLLALLHAKSEHVSLDAAIATLGINGVRPTTEARPLNVNVGISVGYVLDLREPADRTPPSSRPTRRPAPS
jgi:hypothetical protein